MADDIVTYTRTHHHHRLGAGQCLMCDAADEIERLRSALDAEGNDTNLLMLEIERLRSQLNAWRAAAEAYEKGMLATGDGLVQRARNA